MSPRKNADGTVTYLGVTYDKLKDAPLKNNHLRSVGRGWDRYGYHVLIHRDGTEEIITPINRDLTLTNDEMTWGCAGQNENSIHVALVGGRLQDNKPLKKKVKFFDIFTYAQFMAIQRHVKKTLARYEKVKVCGHYKYSKKMCPNFDVADIAELFDLEAYFV